MWKELNDELEASEVSDKKKNLLKLCLFDIKHETIYRT